VTNRIGSPPPTLPSVTSTPEQAPPTTRAQTPAPPPLTAPDLPPAPKTTADPNARLSELPQDAPPVVALGDPATAEGRGAAIDQVNAAGAAAKRALRSGTPADLAEAARGLSDLCERYLGSVDAALAGPSLDAADHAGLMDLRNELVAVRSTAVDLGQQASIMAFADAFNAQL
jgi:hypothetical protein